MPNIIQNPVTRVPVGNVPFRLASVVALLLGASITGCGTQSEAINAVIVSAAQPNVRLGESTVFSVSTDGAQPNGTWQVANSPASGTISQAGVFQAPSTMLVNNVVSVSYATGTGTYVGQVTLWNPQPAISAVSATSLTALTTPVLVTGSGFIPSSTALLNGSAVPTTYVDGNHLSVIVALTGSGEGSLGLAVQNPEPGQSSSANIMLSDNIPPFTVMPATLSGGDVTITVAGGSVDATSYVTLDGKKLPTTFSNNSLTATGYLVPWKTGSSSVGVVTANNISNAETVTVPIAATAVSYDTASRFVTQASLGPRHDVIEHIQQIGLDAFITEQLSQPPLTYVLGYFPTHTVLNDAVTGNSLLRQRVSSALQSFVTNQNLDNGSMINPWRTKMDLDAFGNFRQVLEDAAGDELMGLFLNLDGDFTSGVPSEHPNQNFAREVLQLFSMGPEALNDDGTVQLDASGNAIPNYDQNTIIDLSRALTGWLHTPADGSPYDFYFQTDLALPMIPEEFAHDHGQKVLFGSVVLPAGQTIQADKEQALDAIFAQPSVPPYVSRILIQRLVKSGPSPAYVQRISKVFEDDGTGVRGNMAAIVRTILEDPEARSGDTTPSAADGFQQDPWLWETSAASLLEMTSTDDSIIYVPWALGEVVDNPSTVFGSYSPTYMIPGTTINSPEFQLQNDVSVIQRQQFTYSMVFGLTNGFRYEADSYLHTHFTNLPEMVDALNHMLFHGQMSPAIQTAITSYCSGLQGNGSPNPLDTAIFLALNSDSYQVSH